MLWTRFGTAHGPATASGLLTSIGIELRAFDASRPACVRRLSRFGKGSGHKAQLNLGIVRLCARPSLDLPLLYKGDDFIHTDVRSALA